MNTSGDWFEVGIQYEKTMEDGMAKKVTEVFCLDAVSFTEAEERIVEEMQPYIQGEFAVKSEKLAPYKEVFLSDDAQDDSFFKAKLLFITLDEKSGKEKRTPFHVLVQAVDLRKAVKRIDECMKGTMADYTIASVSDTKITDVFPFRMKEATGDE